MAKRKKESNQEKLMYKKLMYKKLVKEIAKGIKKQKPSLWQQNAWTHNRKKQKLQILIFKKKKRAGAGGGCWGGETRDKGGDVPLRPKGDGEGKERSLPFLLYT